MKSKSHFQVRISVLDRNDSPPRFKEGRKHINVSESAPVEQEILTLTAIDEDTIGNVTYSILRGSERKFSVGKNTGKLTLLDSLDRELKDEFFLIISASDGIQESTMKLFIKVRAMMGVSA